MPNYDSTTLMFAALYASVSSTLGIANKWALVNFPYPGCLTAAQFAFTTLVVWSFGKLNIVEVPSYSAEFFKKMLGITIVFYTAIFTNTKILQYSTVELFIAFRAVTPILVCLVDTLYRKQPVPSRRVQLCLLGIFIGACGFAATDSAFDPRGYMWAGAYLATIVVEMVYAKVITKSVGSDVGTWGLVLYQNTLSVMIWPFAMGLSGEGSQVFGLLGAKVEAADGTESSPLASLMSFSVMFPVMVTCVLGAAISFAGWGTRSRLDATSFTVLGVACKIATVLINLVVWKRHSSMISQVPLLLCIGSSVAYSQYSKMDAELREHQNKLMAQSTTIA